MTVRSTQERKSKKDMTRVQRFWPAMGSRLRLLEASVLTTVLLVWACGSDSTGGGSTNGAVATAGAKPTAPNTPASSGGTGASVAAAAVGGAAGSAKPVSTQPAPVTAAPTGAAGAKAEPGDVMNVASGGKAAPSSAAGATASAGTGGGSAGSLAAAGGGAPPATTGTADKSPGCGMPAPATPPTSIMLAGGKGDLIVDVPKAYDSNKAYPLILVWHGFGVKAPMFHDYLNMKAVAGEEAIIVTPECVGGGSNWPSDMSYPDALLEEIPAKYCIDKKRIFTTGHSMGGMYTAQIGCQRADKFRADAVLAAPHATGNCMKGNMAAMMAVGMSDGVANYMTEFSYWSMYGGCDMSMKKMVDPMSFYKGALDESGVCTDYGGCKAETPVRTCTFAGGHEIPPWVAGAVWDFFKKL